VVWARDGHAIAVCPKSYITSQSVAWVEEYLVRRRLEHKGIDGLGARKVEAFLILENELNKFEGSGGQSERPMQASDRHTR